LEKQNGEKLREFDRWILSKKVSTTSKRGIKNKGDIGEKQKLQTGGKLRLRTVVEEVGTCARRT